MLDEYVVVVNSKKQFDKEIGDNLYFVNMNGNVRTLHRKNCSSCPHSKMAISFITFNSEKEIEEFEKAHRMDTPFKRCRRCF